MLMSANAVENIPLTSTEFNQSGSDSAHFDQKHNTHYREYLETQEDDIFESMCNMESIENTTCVKDHMIHTSCIVMDPNQPPVKVT